MWFRALAGGYTLALSLTLSITVFVASWLERRSAARRVERDAAPTPASEAQRWIALVAYGVLPVPPLAALVVYASDPNSQLWPALADRNVELGAPLAVVLGILVVAMAVIGSSDLQTSRAKVPA